MNFQIPNPKRAAALVRALFVSIAFISLPPLAPGGGRHSLAAEPIPDVKSAKGIESFPGSEAARAMLQQNGFVVLPRYYHRVFSPYTEIHGLPHYVTADSIFSVFHTVFENAVKEVERSFAKEAAEMTTAMAARAHAQAGQAGASGPDADAAALAEAYFAVAARLFGATVHEPDRLKNETAAELNLIRSADCVAPSPLFGRDIDYTLFRPRGFYTQGTALRAYFQALTWYGDVGFRIENDRETRAALWIVRAFGAEPTVRDRWQAIDRVYSHFLAPCDDLTPVEYAQTLAQVDPAGTKSPGETLELFRTAAAKLRTPRIDSMPSAPDAPPEARRSKGLRFMGRRYIPDSAAFMEVTHPAVSGRGMPGGLDILAANGSTRARELALRQGGAVPDASTAPLGKGFDRAAKRLETFKRDAASSHYTAFLDLAATLTAPPDPRAPAFARSPAYVDKNLMTALSAWASMRHTWQLHAKQSYETLGDGGDETPAGYVEPNPAFFAGLKSLVARTREILRDVPGVNAKRLQAVEELVATLAGMVDKELNGQAFTKEERQLLMHYGDELAGLEDLTSNMSWDSHFPWMTLVSDIHTETQSQRCLEVARGGAMPIYVVLTHQGKDWLLVGGVCSYFEFTRPIAERMTDETWREAWDRRQLPPMPDWTRSFVFTGAPDIRALIERLRRGEWPEDILSVTDPDLDAYLEKAVQPGGELEKSFWALDAAAARLGRKMVPSLLQLVKTAERSREVDEQGGTRYIPGRADAAARALTTIATREDLQALTAIALGKDSDHAFLVVEMAGEMRDASAEDLLVTVLAKSDDRALRRKAAAAIATRGRRDVTPLLLDALPGAPEAAAADILATSVSLWRYFDQQFDNPPKFASELGEEDAAILYAKVKETVVRMIGDARGGVRLQAIRAAGELRIAEAVPAIDKAVPTADADKTAADALSSIGTEAALDVLIRLTHSEWSNVRDDVLCALRFMVRPTLDPRRNDKFFLRAVPRLQQLLDDKGTGHYRNARVCDRAAWCLDAILPDGPGFDIANVDLYRAPQRDARIAEWKTYLDRMPATRKEEKP